MTEFKVGDRVRADGDLLHGHSGTVERILNGYLHINWDGAPTDPKPAAGGWLPSRFARIEGESKTSGSRGVDLARGARQETYGHPRDNFTVIGDLWTAYLDGIDYDSTEDGTPLSPENVGAMMILLKVARTINDDSADSLDDIDGYAECIRMIRAANAAE